MGKVRILENQHHWKIGLKLSCHITRLKKAGVYEEYLEWHRQGKTYDEFQEMRAKRTGNYRILRQQAKTDGLSRGKRRYWRDKARSDEMMKEGIHKDDTPVGKKRILSNKWSLKPKQCKLCPLVTENYDELRRHRIRAHSQLMIDIAAGKKDGHSAEDVENLKILKSVFDGDYQWRKDHYMKISGSNVGLFMKWTGRGKDSSITNALIDRPSFNTEATAHGRMWEKEAIRQYSRIFGVPTAKHDNRCFKLEGTIFQATTDGVIGEDGLIEVKCPMYSIPKMMKKRERNGSNYLEYCKLGDGKILRLKRSSEYFFQCVLQLIYSGRAYLEFIVAYRDNEMVTENENGRWVLWSETIYYTEAAWHWNFMEPKLSSNYSSASRLIKTATSDDEIFATEKNALNTDDKNVPL